VHSSHRLIRNLPDHVLDQVKLRSAVFGRLAEIVIAVSDAYGSFFAH
jgi:hypothetical protein